MICPSCGGEFDAMFEYEDRCPNCGEIITRCPHCGAPLDGEDVHECSIP